MMNAPVAFTVGLSRGFFAKAAAEAYCVIRRENCCIVPLAPQTTEDFFFVLSKLD